MKRFFRWFLLILFIGLAVCSGYHIHAEKKQYRLSADLYARISQEHTVQQEQTTSEEALQVSLSPPITVDFEKLRETNPDVIAWLCCPEAGIDLPVVQGKDNDFYLHTLFDGTKNKSGTLFADHRCKPTDPVTIIYGHNMKNGSMFGSLPSAAFDDDSVIWYITPDSGYAFRVLTGRVVAEDSEIYALAGSRDLSAVDAIINADRCERYLILSTCSYKYEGARYILIGGYDPQ